MRGRLLALLLLCAATPAAAVDLGATWIGDFGTVLDGGLRQGERALGLVEATLDDEFVLAHRDWAVHVAAQHVYGGGFSERWVGDLQTVSNLDADDGTRILQAWFAVPLGTNVSLKAGRYDLNSEFDKIEAGGLFLSSSQGIGADIAQTGAAGPSIFPRTAFGLRLQYDPDGNGLVRGVALDVESDSGTDSTDTPFAGGSMVALEYQREVRATTFKAGAWSFTAMREATASDGREREYGAYASAEHRIADRWSVYARAGAANADASRIAQYYGAGAVYRRGLLSACDDEVGLAVAHARNGEPYRDAMRAEGQDTTAAETAIELTWRVPLAEHVVLQPDIQYVIDPDTDPAIENALVFLLRVELVY
jgi:porin